MNIEEMARKVSTGERLKEIQLFFGYKSDEEFAKKIGVSKSTYSTYINGGRDLKVWVLLALYERWGVSITWLLTGQGSMFVREDSGADYDRIVAIARCLPREQQLKLCQDLSREN